ncbi:MAG TPA: hypothetical protein VGH49_11835, partial [Xanthobacteraceae bacterium]
MGREPAENRTAGLLPVIRSPQALAYRFAAANRRFLFGLAARVFWLKVAVVAAFCIGLALSPHAWIGPRSFPTVPVSGLLPVSIHRFDLALFAGLFGLALAILAAAKPQRYIAAFLGVAIVFCA